MAATMRAAMSGATCYCAARPHRELASASAYCHVARSCCSSTVSAGFQLSNQKQQSRSTRKTQYANNSWRKRDGFHIVAAMEASGTDRSTENGKAEEEKDGTNTRLGVKGWAAAIADRKEGITAGCVTIILLAGGVGKRMKAGMPKQYLPLKNQPICLHSFHTFASLAEVGEVVVVCEPAYRHIFEEAASTSGITLKWALPGKERQDSVFNGLQEMSSASKLVAVHDSARPLITSEDTRRVINDAWEHGAAVLGVKVKGTIKEVTKTGFVEKTLDRSVLWEMQTPQVIRPHLLFEGFDLVTRKGLEVTDDVSIVEYLNHPVRVTEGSYTNIKVTTPEDMLLAEKFLEEEEELVQTLAT